MKLGVNLDHVATVREARKGLEPSVLEAAKVVLNAGADGITVHLREDRRHIQDQDVIDLRKITNRLNLEMAATFDMCNFALHIRPDFCCLVPEKRQEITTEGGLNVVELSDELKPIVERLNQAGILVSLFIDPIEKQIESAAKTGAAYIELHTGAYANAKTTQEASLRLSELSLSSQLATTLGLHVNAGHGLNYANVSAMHSVQHLEELNIGHSIVSRAVFVGLHKAVAEMKDLLKR